MTNPIDIGSPTPNAGNTGGSFLSSGTVSGTVIEHFQTVSIHYKFATRTDSDGSWLPGGVTTSGLILTIDGIATDELYDFNTSATGDANIRQEQVVSFSSFTVPASTSALGTEGIIYTTTAGVTRQWADSNDVSSADSWHYPKVWYPTAENISWQTQKTAADALILGILGQINKGGLEYSVDQTSTGLVKTIAHQTFYLSLLS